MDNLRDTSIEIYRQAWMARKKYKDEEMESKRLYLRGQAKILAQILKSEYNLSDVWLIGSLCGHQPLSWLTDIDLVVKGIPPEVYWKILSRLYEALPDNVQLDLIPFEDAEESLQQKTIEKGMKL